MTAMTVRRLVGGVAFSPVYGAIVNEFSTGGCSSGSSFMIIQKPAANAASTSKISMAKIQFFISLPHERRKQDLFIHDIVNAFLCHADIWQMSRLQKQQGINSIAMLVAAFFQCFL